METCFALPSVESHREKTALGVLDLTEKASTSVPTKSAPGSRRGGKSMSYRHDARRIGKIDVRYGVRGARDGR